MAQRSSAYRYLLTIVTEMDAAITEPGLPKRVSQALLAFLKDIEHKSSPPIDDISMQVLGLFILLHLKEKFSPEEYTEGRKILAAYFRATANYLEFVSDHATKVLATETQ
jgi:hypothetical protein